MKIHFLKLILFGSFVHMGIHPSEDRLQLARQKVIISYIVYDKLQLETDALRDIWYTVNSQLYHDFQCADDNNIKKEVLQAWEMNQRYNEDFIIYLKLKKEGKSDIDAVCVGGNPTRLGLSEEFRDWGNTLKKQWERGRAELGVTMEEYKRLRFLWQKDYTQLRDEYFARMSQTSD